MLEPAKRATESYETMKFEHYHLNSIPNSVAHSVDLMFLRFHPGVPLRFAPGFMPASAPRGGETSLICDSIFLQFARRIDKLKKLIGMKLTL